MCIRDRLESTRITQYAARITSKYVRGRRAKRNCHSPCAGAAVREEEVWGGVASDTGVLGMYGRVRDVVCHPASSPV